MRHSRTTGDTPGLVSEGDETAELNSLSDSGTTRAVRRCLPKAISVHTLVRCLRNNEWDARLLKLSDAGASRQNVLIGSSSSSLHGRKIMKDAKKKAAMMVIELYCRVSCLHVAHVTATKKRSFTSSRSLWSKHTQLASAR